MECNYMPGIKSTQASKLTVGQCFMWKGHSQLYMRIPNDTHTGAGDNVNSVRLDDGSLLQFGPEYAVIPCPDAIITRKQ